MAEGPVTIELQHMLDALSQQATTIATSQDMHNDWLGTAVRQISDLRAATDDCTNALNDKVNNLNEALATLSTLVNEVKNQMERAHADQGDKGMKQMCYWTRTSSLRLSVATGKGGKDGRGQ